MCNDDSTTQRYSTPKHAPSRGPLEEGDLAVAFANADPFELTLWKVFSFLCFGQFFLATFPLLQGIYHDRREPQESDSILIFLDEDTLLEADTSADIFPHPEPTKKTLHIVVQSLRVGECPPTVP
jgi:hypothetical protein